MMKTMGEKLVFDAKVSEKKVLIVPIQTIAHTPYNPTGRTKEGAKLKRLIDSVRQHGMTYPILITTDRDLIDGNRRLAAAKALGHETIECIVSGLDRDEMFTIINTTAVPLGGKGWLEIGRGGGKLPDREARLYAELQAAVGNYGIATLIRHNIGLNVLPLCKSVVALGVKRSLEEIIILTARNRLTNKINAELRSDRPDEKKAAAISRILREAAKDAA
jgi:hypothetical protein